MVLDRVVKRAKGDEEEKVGMSLKIPAGLKLQLQGVADENSVSVNSLVVSMIDEMLNPKDNEKGDIYTYYARLLKLNESLSTFQASGNLDDAYSYRGYFIDGGLPDEYLQGARNTIDEIITVKKLLESLV